MLDEEITFTLEEEDTINSRCFLDTQVSELPHVTAVVLEELTRAQAKFPAFHSAHEGFAVLKEEVDELWDEVKMRPDALRVQRMRAEAIQVAAMAMRFILEVCDKESR